MRKIIYTRPDGGLNVCTPVINTIGEVNGFTEADAEKRAWDKLPAFAINPQWVDEVPTDRTFRDAWKHEAGSVSVDMVKAVEIHKNKLRELRAPKLSGLDIEYMKAVESNNSGLMQTIANKKQALRDVTSDPSLTSAKSPDDLKKIIPEILK